MALPDTQELLAQAVERITGLERELAENARMLATQTDLARDAEHERAEAQAALAQAQETGGAALEIAANDLEAAGADRLTFIGARAAITSLYDGKPRKPAPSREVVEQVVKLAKPAFVYGHRMAGHPGENWAECGFVSCVEERAALAKLGEGE